MVKKRVRKVKIKNPKNNYPWGIWVLGIVLIGLVAVSVYSLNRENLAIRMGPSCTDLDGGKNPFLKAYTEDSLGTTVQDACSGTILKEGYCKEDNTADDLSIDCTKIGGTVCESSRKCDQGCYDTDSSFIGGLLGLDSYEVGQVFLREPNVLYVNNSKHYKIDKCGGLFQPANQLTEYRCDKFFGKWRIIDKKVLCEEGCVEGKCVRGNVFTVSPEDKIVVNESNDYIDFVCGAKTSLLGENELTLDKMNFYNNWSTIVKKQYWRQGQGFGAPFFMRTFSFNINFSASPVENGIYEWYCEGVDTGIPAKKYLSKKRTINVSFAVTPEEVESAPTLSYGEIELEKGQPFYLDLNDYFDDTNGDVLTYAWLSVENITITGTSSGTDLVLTPDASFVGTRNWNVTASDGIFNTNVLITLTVLDEENLPPVISSYSPSTASVSFKTGESKIFYIVATDPNGDAIVYSWYVDSVVVPGKTTSTFNFSSSTAKSYSIAAVVSDSKANPVTQTWAAAVSGAEVAPVCGDGTIKTGEVCDGASLGGETCESQGFDSGELACSGDCKSFDTTLCKMNDVTPETEEDEEVEEEKEPFTFSSLFSGKNLWYLLAGVLGVLVIIGVILIMRIMKKGKTQSTQLPKISGVSRPLGGGQFPPK